MSLLIGTPCYGGLATEMYMSSREVLLRNLPMPHDCLTIRNESLITRARNVIASSFLNETSFECLLFWDADIESDPANCARLWNLCWSGGDAPADVAVGAYRQKDPLSGRTVWVNGELRTVSDFKKPFEVDFAGTGYMMIRRKTFERLMEAHPDWKYDEGMPEDGHRDKVGKCWAFFQDPIEEWTDGSRYHLSEDYFFCKRVRELGMKVVMDPEIHLTHWGLYPYA